MIREECVDLTAGIRTRVMIHVAGDGPPVVLLHGWGTSWYVWKDTMLGLTEAGYRSYAPDHIGCGETGKPWRLYTPGDYVTYLHDLLAALQLDKVTLVGHSLGGHIALNYTLLHPQQVSRLVLVDAAYSPVRQIRPTRGELLLAIAGTPLIGEMALLLVPVRLLRWAIGQPWGGFYRPERLPYEFLDRMTLDYLQKATPLVCNSIRYLVLFSLPGLRRLCRDADLLPHLGKIAVPTLVVWGQQDALLHPASFPPLAAGIAGATARPIVEAGHTPPMEAPQEFQQVLLDFLAK